MAPRGKLRSNRQFNPGYPGLLTYSMVDRNTYSYRGFYMDACRGVEFLLSRDEVDGDRIGVTGHSQGGGLTVSTAALRPEIKAAAAGAPYLCGYMDAIELTDAYPYQEIADYLRMNPDSREDVENTLAYFDGINLAHRITCPIIVSVGLQDSTCPPETGFAMFDVIASTDKRMYAYDGHGHDANNHEHGAIVGRISGEASATLIALQRVVHLVGCEPQKGMKLRRNHPRPQPSPIKGEGVSGSSSKGPDIMTTLERRRTRQF